MRTRKTNAGVNAWSNVLINSLPQTVEVHGWDKAVKKIIDFLSSYSFELTENRKPNLDRKFWKNLFDALVKKENRSRSEGTQRRMILVINAVAKSWYEHGLLDEMPSLIFTVKQHRLEVISLSDYYNVQRDAFIRLSDQQRLVSAMVVALSGKQEWPKPIRDEVKNDCSLKTETLIGILGLMLTMTGACGEQVVADLSLWKWSDILVSPDLPVKRPRYQRKGYFWFWLTRMVRGVMLSAYYRFQKEHGKDRKNNMEDQFIFFPNENSYKRPKVISSALNKSLELWCEYAGIPRLQLRDLAALSYMILFEHIPNLYLAAMSGMAQVRPLAEDQMKRFLGIEADYKVIPSLDVRLRKSPEPLHSEVIEIRTDEEEIYKVFIELLEGIKTPLRELFAERYPKNAIMFIQEWLDTNDKNYSTPCQNLIYLVKWLLDLVNDKNVKWSSRSTYWFAVQRVLREFPDILLSDLTEEDITEFIREEFAPSTFRLTKTALKRVLTYLEGTGVAIQKIDWDRIQIGADHTPVRILFREDIDLMVDTLNLKVNPELGKIVRDRLGEVNFQNIKKAIQIAYWFSLRVSEVCRLHLDDVCLKGNDTYLEVRRSKRGKARRETAAHLEKDELHEFETIIEEVRKNNPDRLLLVDENEQPLDSKWLSSTVGWFMEIIGLRDSDFKGEPIHFHNLRKTGADQFLTYSNGDIRPVSIQLGHASVWTTVENYMHTLDLRAVQCMQSWNNPLNDPNVYIPIVVIYQLMGFSSSAYVSNLINDFNKEGEKAPIIKVISPPDREFQPAPGHKSIYISIDDLNRFLVWAIQKKRK